MTVIRGIAMDIDTAGLNTNENMTVIVTTDIAAIIGNTKSIGHIAVATSVRPDRQRKVVARTLRDGCFVGW
ncbi:hypothetical protein W822_03625 [Advenella kashmirensis W13003]|uniref:Uncharacterized protein n=1 Tax=Advenella kashmirensis W13003 TaxID=1424334 RepID=V8QXR6_9BURK|nr:hypothetical protein W822_03625 [Advenella kashmirensis W13003]